MKNNELHLVYVLEDRELYITVDKVQQKMSQSNLRLTHHLGLAQSLHHEFDQKASDDQDQNGSDQLAAHVGSQCYQVVPQLLQSFFHN